jgi:hypothetical protein
MSKAHDVLAHAFATYEDFFAALDRQPNPHAT